MLMFDRVCPTEVVKPGTCSNISKDSAAVTFSNLCGTPDVVDEFVVIEGEVAWDMAVPFGQLVSTIEVKLVVFPNADDRWHGFDGGRELIEPLCESPGFGRISTKLLVEPISIHDVEVGFMSPIPVKIFVCGSAMSNAVKWVLVGAGPDFEAEVEEPFRVVLGVLALLERGQSEERSGKAVGIF